MAIRAETLAEGRGWRVHDIVCDSGPRDKSFTEQHNGYSIAAVTHGSFQYRGSSGAATLVPGSLLLGNHRACFECGHEHAQGDRCLSFRFEPDYFECLSDGAEARMKNFARASLPPIPELARLFADAELARDEHDANGRAGAHHRQQLERHQRHIHPALGTDLGGDGNHARGRRQQQKERNSKQADHALSDELVNADREQTDDHDTR